MRLGILAAFILVLFSCTATDQRMIAEASKAGSIEAALESFSKQKARQYQQNPQAVIQDIENIQRLLALLFDNASRKWGERNTDVPSREKYVKYTQDYAARAIVDFPAGKVTVETVNASDVNIQMRNAIVTTLLSTDDPAATDIFSDAEPQFNGLPFLFNQVLDHDGKPIRYEWRAGRFADHLIRTKLVAKQSGGRAVHSVTFALVDNHEHLRKQQYSDYVLASAAKYQVSPSLIYAIIEAESSFNPFAVSSANAYGLMQVVPATAGKDVYTRVKKRSDMPTKTVLFRPKDNIDIGVAYLHILQDIYLNKIVDNQSKHYATISAYNGGAGNVFKTFHSERTRAPSVINQLSSDQVYQKLTNAHPRQESRRYLYKVVKFKENY
ncbi:MAG: DUF3393 domain-containing protein [Alteromonadaceae bacterium]|nr:DUF3393 domain-containing protein [Alteromonadaceae bacterium]